jgi:hypothetical protein
MQKTILVKYGAAELAMYAKIRWNVECHSEMGIQQY